MTCWDVEVLDFAEDSTGPVEVLGNYEHVVLSSDVDLAEDGKHLIVGREDGLDTVHVTTFEDVEWIRFSFEEGPRVLAHTTDGRRVLLLINVCDGKGHEPPPELAAALGL